MPHMLETSHHGKSWPWNRSTALGPWIRVDFTVATAPSWSPSRPPSWMACIPIPQGSRAEPRGGCSGTPLQRLRAPETLDPAIRGNRGAHALTVGRKRRDRQARQEERLARGSRNEQSPQRDWQQRGERTRGTRPASSGTEPREISSSKSGTANTQALPYSSKSWRRGTKPASRMRGSCAEGPWMRSPVVQATRASTPVMTSLQSGRSLQTVRIASARKRTESACSDVALSSTVGVGDLSGNSAHSLTSTKIGTLTTSVRWRSRSAS